MRIRRYRDFPDKVCLTGKVPTRVDAEVRDLAHAHHTTLSQVMAEALCRHVGLDPREFGINETTRPRGRRVTAES